MPPSHPRTRPTHPASPQARTSPPVLTPGMLGADYSSKFAPWLAHGCLSPRLVKQQCEEYERQRVQNKSTYWLVFELIWRDYFRFYALKHGDTIFHSGGPTGQRVPWNRDARGFEGSSSPHSRRSPFLAAPPSLPLPLLCRSLFLAAPRSLPFLPFGAVRVARSSSSFRAEMKP